jgi:transketolase
MGAYILPDQGNLCADVRERPARYRVYCILGDGECDEGEIWEAAANASHYRLDNLTAIVDNNMFQSTGPLVEKMNILPIAEKFKAFGWESKDIDGNDLDEVIDALDWVDSVSGKPQAIIARTVKGKGFPELEGTNCHFVKITDELLQKGLEALAT